MRPWPAAPQPRRTLSHRATAGASLHTSLPQAAKDRFADSISALPVPGRLRTLDVTGFNSPTHPNHDDAASANAPRGGPERSRRARAAAEQLAGDNDQLRRHRVYFLCLVKHLREHFLRTL